MRFKDVSINFNDLCPQIVLALMVVDQIMKQAGREALITSANDSKHARTSSHYRGMAVDLRSKWFDNPEQVLALCIKALGNNPDFDLLYESKGKSYEHFHLQYLPKRRR